MTEERPEYLVTPAAQAFLSAFVGRPDLLAARMEFDAWHRAALAAEHHERRHLAEAEHWRTERMECEERCKAIVAKHPELREDDHE